MPAPTRRAACSARSATYRRRCPTSRSTAPREDGWRVAGRGSARSSRCPRPTVRARLAYRRQAPGFGGPRRLRRRPDRARLLRRRPASRRSTEEGSAPTSTRSRRAAGRMPPVRGGHGEAVGPARRSGGPGARRGGPRPALAEFPRASGRSRCRGRRRRRRGPGALARLQRYWTDGRVARPDRDDARPGRTARGARFCGSSTGRSSRRSSSSGGPVRRAPDRALGRRRSEARASRTSASGAKRDFELEGSEGPGAGPLARARSRSSSRRPRKGGETRA